MNILKKYWWWIIIAFIAIPIILNAVLLIPAFTPIVGDNTVWLSFFGSLIGALASFNGGGGIFRFIDATRSMPILDRFLVADRPFPLRQLVDAYGFAYLEASSEAELVAVLPEFFSPSDRPVILAINTPGDVSANILRDYLGLQ